MCVSVWASAADDAVDAEDVAVAVAAVMVVVEVRFLSESEDVGVGVALRLRNMVSMSSICFSRRLRRSSVASKSARGDDGMCGVGDRMGVLVVGDRCMFRCMIGEIGSFLLPRVSCERMASLSIRTEDDVVRRGDNGERVAGRNGFCVSCSVGAVPNMLALSALM